MVIDPLAAGVAGGVEVVGAVSVGLASTAGSLVWGACDVGRLAEGGGGAPPGRVGEVLGAAGVGAEGRGNDADAPGRGRNAARAASAGRGP